MEIDSIGLHLPSHKMGGQGRKLIIPHVSPKRYRKRCALPKPLPLGATATTAASGGNREELLGPRPAGCERQRSRRWEPQPGQWHCEAMTERASPFPSNLCTAICTGLCQGCYYRCVFYFSMTSLPSQALRASSPKGRAFDDNKKHPQCIGIAGVFRLDEYQELSVIISGLPAEPRSS